uniref:Uncharacterized protein n=1 Tax=Glossina brevipalpis TaxID=37001 RepID=A0A1A9W4E2_9MUSC
MDIKQIGIWRGSHILLLELEVVEDALLLVPRLIAVTVKTPLLIVCVTAAVVLLMVVVALVLVAVGDCGDSMCSGVRLPSEPSLESDEGGVKESVKAAILAIVKLKVPFVLFLICPSAISGVGEQLEAGDRGSFLMQDSSISISEQISGDWLPSLEEILEPQSFSIKEESSS